MQRYGVAIALVLGLYSLLGAEAVQQSRLSAADFKSKYHTLTSGDEKRDLTIRAIDVGIIRRGLTFEEVSGLFGTDINRRGYDSQTKTLTAIVGFEPFPPSRGPLTAVAREGWYITLKFRRTESREILEDYSLSNLHK